MQEVHLLPGLRPLGNDLDAQMVDHFQNAGNNGADLGAGLDLAGEGHIQLQNIEIISFQHTEGGIAGAEVIQQDLYSRTSQLLQDPGPVALQGRIGGLGDLQAHVSSAEAVPLEDVHQVVHQAVVVEVHPGQVHGHGHHGEVLSVGPENGLINVLRHIPVQPGYLAAALQGRNKDGGRHHAPLGVDPADQGLSRHQVAGGGLHHRLIVDLEFLILEGGLVFRQKLHPVHIAPAHGIIKEGVGQHMVMEDALLRQLGPVDHGADVDIVLLQIVDTAVAVELHAPAVELDVDLQLGGQGIQVDALPLRKADEMIRIQSAGNLRLKNGVDAGIELLQNAVAALGAEELVGGLEVLDVEEHEDVILGAWGIIQDVFRPADKAAPVVAAGQGILIFMLVQRQNILDSVQDDLRAEGLGEIVHGSQLVGMEHGSVGSIAGNDDHRQVLQELLLAQTFQHIEAVHHRHLDVQQHEPVDPLPGLDHLNGLGTVFRLVDLIAVLQDILQQFPVDQGIVYNENILLHSALLLLSCLIGVDRLHNRSISLLHLGHEPGISRLCLGAQLLGQVRSRLLQAGKGQIGRHTLEGMGLPEGKRDIAGGHSPAKVLHGLIL